MSASSPGFDRLEDALAQLEAHRDRAAAVADEVAAMRVEAEDEDRTIGVTLGGDGRLLDLRLDARAMRLGSEQLGPAIVAVVDQAAEQHRAEVQRLTATLVADLPGPTTTQEMEAEMDATMDRWLGRAEGSR